MLLFEDVVFEFLNMLSILHMDTSSTLYSLEQKQMSVIYRITEHKNKIMSASSAAHHREL